MLRKFPAFLTCTSDFCVNPHTPVTVECLLPYKGIQRMHTQIPEIHQFDIVVIGSGPAGATVARIAASQHLKVLMIDKKQELGAPVQCSGAVSAHAIEHVGLQPDGEFINEEIYGFRIFNAAGVSTDLDYRQIKSDNYGPDKKGLGYVVDRRRFDRFLLTQAERAGAEVWLKTEGLNYYPQSDGTCLIEVRRFNENITIQAHILVGADGLQSQVGKWAGLHTQIKLNELASCLQFITDRVETNGLLEIITGDRWAPGGYGWIFPKGHGYAEIGIGVIRSSTGKNPQWFLDQLIHHSFLKQRFKHVRILEIQGGGVPLAAPLIKQYADNLILVGDAARHVNPITGGGIHTALAGGKIAAEYISGIIKNKILPSEENLKGYQDKWLEELGSKMWKLYELKNTIFKTKDVELRDQLLFNTMSEYFSPDSEYKKI